MELTQYLKILRKWGWLVVLVAFLSGSAAFVLVSSQPATYEASVIVRIGDAFENPDPNVSQINIARDLTQEYVEILRTYSVRQATIEALELPFEVEDLGNLVTTRILPNTSLLVIQVTYTDPVLAADIANQLGEELRERSPNELTAQQQIQVDVANSQIETLTEDIQALRAELETINEQLAQAEAEGEEIDPTVLANLTERRGQLITQIIQTDANIAQYQANIVQYNTRTNSATIIEPARIPQNPSERDLLQVLVVTVVLSGAFVFGLVVIYEYVNDTIGTAEEATRMVQVPVVGVISRIGGNRKDGYQGRLVSEQSLMSQTTEEYRTLRANLSFVASTREEGQPVFVVTSGLPSEGKSLTTANLAITMALSGKRVLLIDADLRRPKQHEIFQVDSTRGLTSLLAATPLLDDEVEIYDLNREDEERSQAQLEKVMFATAVENLRIIPSGFLPQNPNEILGSVRMKGWIRMMQQVAGVDVILIDSPPCLAISDAPVMAANLNANVLLVLEAERTRRRAAQRSKERFDNAGVGVLGLVLNGANARAEDYYGYGYGSSYYLQLEPANTPPTSSDENVRW